MRIVQETKKYKKCPKKLTNSNNNDDDDDGDDDKSIYYTSKSKFDDKNEMDSKPLNVFAYLKSLS